MISQSAFNCDRNFSNCSIKLDYCGSQKICQSGVLNIGLSYHFIVYCTRKLSKCFFNKHNTVKVRSVKSHKMWSITDAVVSVTLVSSLIIWTILNILIRLLYDL
jgi:hypothetical protein